MTKVGEHVTLDILGTEKEYSPNFYEKLVYKIAKAAKVEVLNIHHHKFEPQGLTLVALLAESHMSFHTFPEKNVISFDFFTCGKKSPNIALEIIKKEIKHKRIIVKNFDRDNVSLYDDIYSTRGQKKFYVVNDVLEDFVSKAGQHIEILNLEEFGKSLFIDNELQVTEKDEYLYSRTFVRSATKLNPNNSSVAIIGGGDGGVARECISKKFGFIDWFELDPEVVRVSRKHLSKVENKAKENNSVKCIWGDAFENIKSIQNFQYDKIFVDLNDDQYCINLAAKNIKNIKRILKPGGILTAQVGSYDKKPKQVKSWLNVLEKSFGNTTLNGVFIPSFDCNWNFASSIFKAN